MSSIFNDQDFREELRRNASMARERVNQIRCPEILSAGDSFVFTESYDLPVRWVCVQAHVDNPAIWYLVAADEYHQVGTCDIELPESHSWAPLYLRCKVGFWAHRDDLDENDYVGKLEGDSILDARHRLSEMVLGQIPVTESGLIAEADEQYSDWICELNDIADRIENRLQSEPIVLTKTPFGLSWANDPIVAMRLVEASSLAADGFGEQQSFQIPPAITLPSTLPGRLLLQLDNNDLDLAYYPSHENELPPKLVFASTVNVRTGSWILGSDGVYTWSQSLSRKSDDELILALGSERFKIHLA